jgi:hypothetical protein
VIVVNKSAVALDALMGFPRIFVVEDAYAKQTVVDACSRRLEPGLVDGAEAILLTCVLLGQNEARKCGFLLLEAKEDGKHSLQPSLSS